MKEHQREIKKNRKEEKVLENRNNYKDFQKYYKAKCQALTKTGKKCARDAVGSKYCWQHRKEEEKLA